jgi:ABC-type Mn2+/Zn2+ transport system ATPase subunit
MTHDALRFDNVTVCYGKVPAVHHVDATLTCGTLAALMGPNGAGKSTLLRAVLGLMPLTTGRITVGGTDSLCVRRRIAYLPQRSSVDWDFPLTVAEVVAQGRYPTAGWWRGFSAADHDAVTRAIIELGLDHVATRPIAALSGGQQQRVLLARALASGADVLLLDEPFSGLDAPAISDLAHRLQAWADAGRLVLAALHDVELARQAFRHVLLMNTHLVACGPVEEVLSDQHLIGAYGPSGLGRILHRHEHGHCPPTNGASAVTHA